MNVFKLVPVAFITTAVLAWPQVLPEKYARFISAGDFAGLIAALNEQFDIPPVALTEPAVVYPAIAGRAGAQGTVKLLIFIDETGGVKDVVVADSPGWLALEEAARRAAAEIRYRPALKDDRPVAAWYIANIIFYIPAE